MSGKSICGVPLDNRPQMRDDRLRFSITPFYVTRQYYYALETGAVTPDGFELDIEYNHSPVKDQVLICGKVDATTMSMGKYILAKSISDSYVLPTDPFAIATSLTYKQGNGLFVRSASDIESPQDLEGKRLGIHDKSMVLVYHKAILEDLYDVDISKIEWVFDTHQGLTTRMEEGDIDAVERVGDWYFNLDASPAHTKLYDMAEQWNTLCGYDPIVHIVAADKRIYDETPAVVDSFVEALQASTKYRDDHYEEILSAFAAEGDGQSEWSGDRDIESIRNMTNKSTCPFVMEEPQRENFREWMSYAVRYGVLAEPIDEARLYPL